MKQNMNHRIVIYGNGDVASVAVCYFRHDSPHDVVALTVDRTVITTGTLLDIPVIPFDEIEAHFPPQEYKMHVAIGFAGMNILRAKKYCEAKAKGYEFVSCISSKAVLYPDLSIGDNCCIGANTVIQPFATVGNDVIIRDNCVIGHHTQIMDHCFIGIGAAVSGNVTMGTSSLLGSNATLKDNIRIGNECLIGAGVTMLQDSGDQEVYINKLAKKLAISSDKLCTNRGWRDLFSADADAT